jgi:probable HAF family extracellular repeat protein
MNKYSIIKQFKLLLIIICIVLCCGCQPPPPVEYEYTELLPEGWRNGSVVDINDKGEVIGDGKDSNGAGKTFLYSNGEYKEILPPGSEYFYAVAINNSGEVIGTDGHGGTFIYCGGTYREVTPPAGWESFGVADINDYGEITGNLVNLNGVDKGFIAVPK